MDNKTQTAKQVIQLLNLSSEIDFKRSTFFTYERDESAFYGYEFLRIAPDIKIIINEKTGVLKVMKGVNMQFVEDGVEGLRKINFLNKFFEGV